MFIFGSGCLRVQINSRESWLKKGPGGGNFIIIIYQQNERRGKEVVSGQQLKVL